MDDALEVSLAQLSKNLALVSILVLMDDALEGHNPNVTICSIFLFQSLF